MYQNYHRHTDYSNFVITDSVVSNEDYCKRALEVGARIISSCEHGTPGNWHQCASLAEKYGLKWRYVMEAYFVKDRREKDRTNAHLIVAAKTAKGIGDINFVFSEASLSGYYYHPRLDMELLMSLDPRDVFITTACVGGVFKYGFEEAETLIAEINSRFKGSFMLEVQNHNTQKQKDVTGFIMKMYRKYNIPLIAGMDSHYIFPEQDSLRKHRLEANNIHYEDEDGWFMDYPTEDEAIRRFKEQGILSDAQIMEAMDNTNIFLEFEDVKLDKSKKLPTIYPNLTQEERNNLYVDTVMSEWEIYSLGMNDEEKEKYLKEIKYETDVVTSTNMSDYFLLDYEIVKRAKKKGAIITQTGRGSCVSYFTNSLLGLSSVDRLQIPVEMFPDRFISKDRILSGSLPDIDLNCYYPEIVAEAQSEILGEWSAAPMVAYGTLRRASAWKMYCRAADIPFDVANSISDRLKQYELDVKHADEDEAEDIDVYSYVPEEYHEMLAMSEAYMGMIDNISPHPCAHLLFQGDIRRELGIYRINSKTGKKGTVYAAFIDGATAEEYGYLKNDILAVDTVGINKMAFDMVGIPQPSVMRLLEMTKRDPDTWRMYADGLTMGLNQVEQDKTTDKVMRFKPRNITELAAFVAAVRPAFQSMINIFLSRQTFSYDIPAFDELMQTREMKSSFIIYQEQTMKTLQYAGFSAPESYSAIKAIAKKHPEKVLPLKQRFLGGFTAKADAESAEKVWRIIEDATSYGFNSSHAVCVALDSLYAAYLKAHHPYEFYITILDVYGAKGNKERLAKIKEEMKRGFGITISPCYFRQDNRNYYIDKEAKTISDSITSIKYMSKGTANVLYELRNSRFDTFVDLLLKFDEIPEMNTRKTEILIRLGYFKEFGGTRKLLDVFNEFTQGVSKYAKTYCKSTQEKRLDLLRDYERKHQDDGTDFMEQIRAEIEFCGTPISSFPDAKGHFAVIQVDEKYSPKIKLYNIQSGTTGEMKMRKKVFVEKPLAIGDIITLDSWEKKPKYQFVNKKPISIPGVHELWINYFTKVS